MLNRKKKMAVVLAMLSAVTLLSGCGKGKEEPIVGANTNPYGWSVNPITGQPINTGNPGSGCATLTAAGATLGFTNQVSSQSVGNGASQQQAQMIGSNGMGPVAIMQVNIQNAGAGYGNGYPGYGSGYGAPATVTGVIQITPNGAQALLAEAMGGGYGGFPGYGNPGYGNGFPGYGGAQSVQVCIGSLQGVTFNPLRGPVYLSGLPMPRSGLPHLYFQ